jgi:ubiquinone/menaquinone biosynthesis C-methylase UbiE
VYDVELHRDWLLSLVELPPSGAILDVGCGKGADLLALASRTQDPRSSFVGVDASADHIAVAQESSKDGRVEFARAKVGPSLSFNDDTFDVLLTQEVLECLPHLDAFVPELARVLRPGGQIIASHYDWDTQIFNGSDRERTRRVLRAWAEHEQSWMDHVDPWMGRRLWGHLEGSGLFEGEVQVRVMTNTEFAEPWHGYRLAHWFKGLVKRGQISESDYGGFLADLGELATNGEYFWSVNRYVYVGRRTAL